VDGRAVWALVLASLVAGTAAPAASPRVLLTSGVRIEGLGVASLEDPRATDAGAVFFRGADTSIALGGVTFHTGDPLPAGLSGTIEELLQGEVIGDRSAVLTATNGPDVAQAIFSITGGVVEPLVTIAPDDPTDIRTFVMNEPGDLAYLTRSGTERDLFTRAQATGEVVHVAGPDRDLLKLRGFVIDRTGAAAWIDRRGGVFHWDATHGTRAVVTARPAQRRGGRPAVALDATFGLVFVTKDSVGRFVPETGDLVVVRVLREQIAGLLVRRLYGNVGFDAAGNLVVEIRAKKSSVRYLCFDAAGQASVCDGPGSSGAGTVVQPDRSSAIFRLRDGDVVPVVKPGDVLPGTGTLRDLTGHAVDGPGIAFLGVLDDGRDVLGGWRDGRLETLAVDGQRAGSRTIDLGSLYDAGGPSVVVGAALLDATGDAAAAATGVVVVRRRGSVASILRPRGKRFAGLGVEDAGLAGARLVAIGTGNQLLATRNRRLTPLLVPGAGAGSELASIDALVVAGSRIVFQGTDLAGTAGLYELDGARPSLLDVLPGPALLLAGDGRDVAVSVQVPNDSTWIQTLELVGPGRSSSVAVVGDPTPVGAIASFDWTALTGADVVVSSRVFGDGARHALLAIARGR
jgi:hypothetical protein